MLSNPKGPEATTDPGSEMPGLTTQIQNIKSVRTKHEEGQEVPAMKRWSLKLKRPSPMNTRPTYWSPSGAGDSETPKLYP